MGPQKSKSLHSLYNVDARLETFLYLLNCSLRKNDGGSSESTSRTITPRKLAPLKSDPEWQPTSVPVPMASHVLRLQGVSYLDANIATVASLAADKFLATLLTQAIACRNHRLKGDDFVRAERAEHAKNAQERKEQAAIRMKEFRAKKHSVLEAKRDFVRAHKAWVVATRDKSKRKKQPLSALQNTMMNAFETVRSLERSCVGDSHLDSKRNETTKKGEAQMFHHDRVEEDLDLEDHLNEDHLFFHSDGNDKEDFGAEDDDGDTRFCLQVRDVVNPLSAWGMDITGKTGVASPGLSQPPSTKGFSPMETLWHTQQHGPDSPGVDIADTNFVLEPKPGGKADAPHSTIKSSGTKKVKTKGT